MRTELDYSYLGASTLATDREGSHLALSTSGGGTAAGDAKHPFFFSGFVEHPGVVAQALLAVARVARTRFYVPPNTQAAVLRAADPVVTSTPGGLRFESFSACCGVYARLDIGAASLDATQSTAGVTNVDVNPPLRQALAGLRASEPLHLKVGQDELRVSTLDAELIEEKVPLPSRWLKGFAEIQTLSSGMVLRHTLPGTEARQFVRALPRSSATRTVMWATRNARSLRLASRASLGSVSVGGPERLRVMEPLLRFAIGLRAYGFETPEASLPSASEWVLELPGARLTIGLSPEKARGFSGEGNVLHALGGAQVSEDADLISAVLAFEPHIDVAVLARDAKMTPVRVSSALALLASSGQVGYDVAAGAYFHRPLPMHSDALGTLHPRLVDAQALVDSGSVTRIDPQLVRVCSGQTSYEVCLAQDSADDRCTCPWYAKHRGTSGPCKHVLAARISIEEPEA